MAEKQPKMPDVGPVGQNLIAAVEELRKARGWSWRQMSAKLSEIGRPIFPLGLSRLAKAERRVDVDELVALAVVLGVNPNALLFDRRAARDDVLELTPVVRQRAWIVWRWAGGGMAMPEKLADESGSVELDPAAEFFYQDNTRPDLAKHRDHAAAQAVSQLSGLVSLYLMGKTGTRDRVRRALQRVTIEIEELLAEGDE